MSGAARSGTGGARRGEVVNQKPTNRQRLRYAFDNTMSRGTPALVGWLAALTGALILVFTSIILAANLAPNRDGSRHEVIDQFFRSFLDASDPGAGRSRDPSGDHPEWQPD